MSRKASVDRKTRETNIRVEIDLDGTGVSSVKTPIGFLTHMLEQIARHGLFDLVVEAEGDTQIDGHHVFAFQFHPEKSDETGRALLDRFLAS